MKRLAALKNLEAKEIIALAKKRKGLKVPDMEEGDLIMEHSLTNSKGQSIKAKFISSSESEVTLLISEIKSNEFVLELFSMNQLLCLSRYADSKQS